MILILYEIFLIFFLILFFPFIYKRIRNQKDFYGDWKERLGIFNKQLVNNLSKEKNIWIHTVSIGEFLSILPLIEKLKKENSIVISFTTKTGRKVAEEKLKDVYKVYFPFDISFIVKKVIKLLNPKIILIAETEIWPNLIINAYRKKIPLIIINGRISDNSFNRYKKVRFLTKKILPYVSKIIMRSEDEKNKIIFLGAEEKNVIVGGSFKFDTAFWLSKEINSELVRKKYGIEENKKLIVFGSIHPEEEEGVINIIKKIMDKYKDLIFVIVPRYLDRTKIYEKLEKQLIRYIRKSQMPIKNEINVIVVDTYGELNNFYSICDIAFVGGSLNGYGGQNPLEPISFGKCVICGKDMFLLKYEWEIIKSKGGGIEVKNFEELYEKIIYLIENPDISKKIGQTGYKLILKNKGAMEKMLEIINSYIYPY